MAGARQVGIAEFLGVPSDSIGGTITLGTREDPEKKAQRDHERERLVLVVLGCLTLGAFVLAAFLCWLSLYFGKPELAEKIVAMVFGLVGGFGIGRSTAPRA